MKASLEFFLLLKLKLFLFYNTIEEKVPIRSEKFPK
tara:strand:- start:277 stop:384 length:108 start_codon:yes stop_codon:yes gene_type:complete